jgi:hypothetical protein
MLAIVKIFFINSKDPHAKKLQDDILDRRASLYNWMY